MVGKMGVMDAVLLVAKIAAVAASQAGVTCGVDVVQQPRGHPVHRDPLVQQRCQVRGAVAGVGRPGAAVIAAVPGLLVQ